MSAAASEYLDQSASELRLHVLRGDLDLDQFTVLKVAMLRRPWIEVNACIIGASHVLRIAVPGEEPLHEILACGAVSATTTPVFTGRAALLAERDHDVAVALSPGRGYRFRSRVATGAEARLALHALQARVARAQDGGDGEALGLRFDFPAEPSPPAGQGGAMTLLHLSTLHLSSADPELVRIESAHSYPNEGAVVFSATELGPESISC